MKRSRYSDEQIAYALRQAESGTAVADVCRQLGIAEATYYVWKKKYGHLGATELRELRQLREENAKLKRVVADLTLDKHILTEILQKQSEAGASAQAGGLGTRCLRHQLEPRVPAVTDFPLAVWLLQPSTEPGSAPTADAGAGPGPAPLRLPAAARAAAA